jgi:methanethiol oxidase
MVEISRDSRRVYWTNSLYSTWDNQFYPDGVPGAQVMANASPNGGLELSKNYWVSFPDGYGAHQIRQIVKLNLLCFHLDFASISRLVQLYR